MNAARVTLASLSLALLAGWSLTSTGCNSSVAMDAKTIESYRTKLALEDEPDGALTVVEIREQFFGKPADHEHAEHEHAEHEHGEAEHAHDEDGHSHHHDEDGQGHDRDADGHHEHGEAGDADEGEHAHDDHETEHAHTEEHGDVGHEDHGEHDVDAQEHGDHQHADEEHADHEHEHHGHEDHAHADHGSHDADSHAHDAHAGHNHAPGEECAFCDAHGSGPQVDVVLVGLVGGLPNAAKQTLPEFPFVKDYAIVMIADPEAVAELADGGHQHAPGEPPCAFCAAHARDHSSLLATVKFSDEKGEVLSVDVRELFQLKEKDMVVVRGKAHLDHDGSLVVDATGLYVRR